MEFHGEHEVGHYLARTFGIQEPGFEPIQMDTKRKTWRVDDHIITLDRTHTNGPIIRPDREHVNDLHFSASLSWMTGIEEGGEHRIWEVVNRRMEAFMEHYKWAFGSAPMVKDDKLG